MPAQVITTLTQLRAVKDEHFVEAFMNHLRLAFDHLRGQKPPTLVARTLPYLRQIRGELLDITQDAPPNKRIRNTDFSKSKSQKKDAMRHIMALLPYAVSRKCGPPSAGVDAAPAAPAAAAAAEGQDHGIGNDAPLTPNPATPEGSPISGQSEPPASVRPKSPANDLNSLVTKCEMQLAIARHVADHTKDMTEMKQKMTEMQQKMTEITEENCRLHRQVIRLKKYIYDSDDEDATSPKKEAIATAEVAAKIAAAEVDAVTPGRTTSGTAEPVAVTPAGIAAIPAAKQPAQAAVPGAEAMVPEPALGGPTPTKLPTPGSTGAPSTAAAPGTGLKAPEAISAPRGPPIPRAPAPVSGPDTQGAISVSGATQNLAATNWTYDIYIGNVASHHNTSTIINLIHGFGINKDLIKVEEKNLRSGNSTKAFKATVPYISYPDVVVALMTFDKGLVVEKHRSTKQPSKTLRLHGSASTLVCTSFFASQNFACIRCYMALRHSISH